MTPTAILARLALAAVVSAPPQSPSPSECRTGLVDLLKAAAAADRDATADCDHLTLLIAVDAVSCAGRLRREQVAWQAIARKFGDKGLKVVVARTDDQNLGEAEIGLELPYPSMADREGLLERCFGVQSAWSPTKLLFDCRGRLLYLGLAASDSAETEALEAEVLKAMLLSRSTRAAAAPPATATAPETRPLPPPAR